MGYGCGDATCISHGAMGVGMRHALVTGQEVHDVLGVADDLLAIGHARHGHFGLNLHKPGLVVLCLALDRLCVCVCV